MKKFCCFTLIFIALLFSFSITAQPLTQCTYLQDNFLFQWDVMKDQASVSRTDKKNLIWQGSLLPAFWLSINGKEQFVKASVVDSHVLADSSLSLNLTIDTYGTGILFITKETWGIRFKELSINWSGNIPAIIEMYFGVSAVNTDSSSVWPTWNRPFVPDWQSFGYCVPGAKEGPVQSYFRFWDFGQSNIALGSFGPSLGAPYGAAFPRPVLYAGMGSAAGFIALGAGAIPDAAMSLKLQPAGGCFQYLYREDLWGASNLKERKWQDPLRITMADDAWKAFNKYYSSFPAKENVTTNAAQAVWNTWGMWKDKKYDVRPIADFAKTTGGNILVMDDPWEASQGVGKPSIERFPHFYDDIKYIQNKGMRTGIWETVGYISRPYENGLDDSDLILNRNGQPCEANWNFSQSGERYYCLDISSEKTKRFLINRTIQIMKTIKPALIKLDFAYGLPSPDAGVPRNAGYRGERYSYELVKLISNAAKSVDPNVIIMLYSISPLWTNLIDLVSLDDQGDLWYDIKQGHQEWSIWASLLSDKNVEISGSSGYDWATDDEVLLNTIITGAPGAVLAIHSKDNTTVPSGYVNRRLAVNKWFRKSLKWYPLWLNSHTGDLESPPSLNCWGRVEISNKDSILTALVLRGHSKTKTEDKRLKNFRWSGRWALVSQDTADISNSTKLAIIPFDAGSISVPCFTKPTSIIKLNIKGENKFTKWTWHNQLLTISISEEDLNTTAGFLINR